MGNFVVLSSAYVKIGRRCGNGILASTVYLITLALGLVGQLIQYPILDKLEELCYITLI